MSPSLSNMTKTFNMVDSFRSLYPSTLNYRHHYHTLHQGYGATRI